MPPGLASSLLMVRSVSTGGAAACATGAAGASLATVATLRSTGFTTFGGAGGAFGGAGFSFFFSSVTETAVGLRAAFLPAAPQQGRRDGDVHAQREDDGPRAHVPGGASYSPACWTLMANFVMPASLARSRMCTTLPC